MTYDQPDSIGDESEGEVIDYAAKKRRIVLMLLAYSAILGVIGVFLPDEESPLDYIVGLPILILGMAWCFVDAEERDHRIGKLMQLALIFFFVVAYPLYLFQTRGIRGFLTLGLAMVLVAVMAACAFSTGYATILVGDVLEPGGLVE